MQKRTFSILVIFIFIIFSFSCSREELEQENFDLDQALTYCKLKLSQSVKNFDEKDRIPRSISNGEQHWQGASINNWTSGFYPGILWNMYNLTGEEVWLNNAIYFTNLMEPVRKLPWKTHDFGFMMYYSYGLAYQNTRKDLYKNILLETADSLAVLFNPIVGTLESWPWMKRKRGWSHTTIIDTMMNLELLFWAAEHGGDAHLRDIAIQHAYRTIKDFIRPDHSTYHIVVYDSSSSEILLKTTDQGFDDNSTWARGQAWATYGFVKAFRYTKNIDFLQTAEELAGYYLDNVPDDLIPYWDFNAPGIPNEPKDASSASITCCALLELSRCSEDEILKDLYYSSALKILGELSSARYLANGQDSFLRRSVGSNPAKSEVGGSLIYTDYFYLEALIKLKKMEKHGIFAQQ